jgi:hypothetical protein
MAGKSRTAQQKGGRTAQALDPRFVALARLLARDLARRDTQKPLSTSPDGAYDQDSLAEDES